MVIDLRKFLLMVLSIGVLLYAVYAQMDHAQHLFFQLAHTQNEYNATVAWRFAIAFESAVFVLVVFGWKRPSYLFALLSAWINVGYYSVNGVDMWQVASWPYWLVSFSLPLVIVFYSHVTASVIGVEQTATFKVTIPNLSWLAINPKALQPKLPSPKGATKVDTKVDVEVNAQPQPQLELAKVVVAGGDTLPNKPLVEYTREERKLWLSLNSNHNHTQRQLADMFGVSTTTIYNDKKEN